MNTTRDLLAAGRTTEAIAHRAAQPPPTRRFRMPGDGGPAMELPNDLYPHELEGRIIALRHVTVVPIKMTSVYAYDCIVVASDHDAYPVGGYLLSVPVAELGSGTIHDGPRPVGAPPDEDDAPDEGPVTDDEFAAFAEGAGFDPQLPDPTDDELIALHGPSTETLGDHLDSLTIRGYLNGYRRELPTWPTEQDPAGDPTGTRPRPGGDALVQAIVVGPGGSHLEVVDAVMRASVGAYLNRDVGNPAWDDWLAGSFTKTVRSTNATKLAELAAMPDTTVVTVGDATAVAFAPMRRDDLPRPVARARVSGLERERPTREQIPPIEGHNVFINDSLPMSTGKTAAQAAHALMVRALNGQWSPTHIEAARVVPISHGLFEVFASTSPEAVIRDAGWTEVAPGSATAIAADVDSRDPSSTRPTPPT